MRAVLAGLRRERSMIGSAMVLKCVDLKCVEKWRAFQDEHSLKTDKDVAEFLLNNYLVCDAFSNVETQTETTWPLSGESTPYR